MTRPFRISLLVTALFFVGVGCSSPTCTGGRCLYARGRRGSRRGRHCARQDRRRDRRSDQRDRRDRPGAHPAGRARGRRLRQVPDPRSLGHARAHLHSTAADAFFPLYAVAGVTAVRDMHTVVPMAQIQEHRQRLAAGTLVGPRLDRRGRAADRRAGGRGAVPSENASSARRAEARGTVVARKRMGVDFVKVHGGLSRELLFAGRRRSQAPGSLRTQATRPARPEEASDAGLRSISTIGVGALLRICPTCSLILGLDDWDTRTCTEIGEDRLLGAIQRRFGPQVKKLYLPPLAPDGDKQDPTAPAIGVPVAAFPRWLRCPLCDTLRPRSSRGSSNWFKIGGAQTERVLFTRAVQRRTRPRRCPFDSYSACREGHLSDFPWVEYVHASEHHARPARSRSRIRRRRRRLGHHREVRCVRMSSAAWRTHSTRISLRSNASVTIRNPRGE